MNIESSQKIGADPRDSESYTNDHPVVVHGQIADHQNSSHIKTDHNLARSRVVYMQTCSEEGRAAMGCETTQNTSQVACPMLKIHDIPPDEVGHHDATVRNAVKEAANSSGTSNAMR